MIKPAKKGIDVFIGIFYILITVLIAFFVSITLKIAFSPVCSTDTQHVCVVDTGSIIGLTAAVFGIAATLLTFLGAFAVAYWWANLDQRVDKQVEARTNELIEQHIQAQEAKFQAQVADKLKAFDTQITSNLKVLDTQIARLEGSFQFVRKELVIAAMLFSPWEVEDWAHELFAIDPSSEVAGRMVMSYLNEVDYQLPDPSMPSKWKTMRVVPNNDPLYYWNKALEWRKMVARQNNAAYLSNADWQLEQRRPRIEEYQKQHAQKP